MVSGLFLSPALFEFVLADPDEIHIVKAEGTARFTPLLVNRPGKSGVWQNKGMAFTN